MCETPAMRIKQMFLNLRFTFELPWCFHRRDLHQPSIIYTVLYRILKTYIVFVTSRTLCSLPGHEMTCLPKSPSGLWFCFQPESSSQAQSQIYQHNTSFITLDSVPHHRTCFLHQPTWYLDAQTLPETCVSLAATGLPAFRSPCVSPCKIRSPWVPPEQLFVMPDGLSV